MTLFNKRYFLFGAIIFIISIYFGLEFNIGYCSLSSIFVLSLCFAALVLTILSILLVVFRKHTVLSKSLIIIIITLTIFFIGSGTIIYKNQELYQNHSKISNAYNFYGVITNPPTLTDNKESYFIETDIFQYEKDNDTVYLDKPIKIGFYQAADALDNPPCFADTFFTQYIRETISEPAYENAFDISRYHRQNGICFVGYSPNLSFVDFPYKKSLLMNLKSLGNIIRENTLSSTENENYSDDEKALLQGIMLGEKTKFSDELSAAYSMSGLSHINAVSGMHTSYLFGFIALFLALLRFPKKYCILITTPILIIFASASLFTPSVVRAVAMIIIFQLAILFNRSNDSITTLFISAVLILIYNPYTLYSYSFILSYSSTLGLLVFAPKLKYLLTYANNKIRLKPLRKKTFFTKLSNMIIKYIASSMVITVSCLLGSSYFIARFFGIVIFGSILATPIITPLVAIIFIGGYLNSLSNPLSLLISKLILSPALSACNETARFFSKPIFHISVFYPSKFVFIIYVVILYLFYVLLDNFEKNHKRIE